MGPAALRDALAEVWARVTARVDGEALVRAAAAGDPAVAAATHVLAVGKVALPMLRGLPAPRGARPALAIAPAPLIPPALPAGVTAVAADHPAPTARSVAAAAAARAFVRGLPGPARLLVLLSGGASSLLCAPADGLPFDDKRAAVAAVARAGAVIAELNAVRKHLSAIKGGRLALEAPPDTAIDVRALSDVVGDDPATIGSGPFSADPTTFAQALAIVDRLAADLPPAAREHLERGARGAARETPKPGDPRLAGVGHAVLAGPRRVAEEAARAAADAGWSTATMEQDTELPVDALAARYLDRLSRELAAGRTRAMLIGNGEPRVALPAGAPRGGRAAHLALLVARGLAALPAELRGRAAFLAAGTDDRDGDTPASGALVDGGTFARARAAGVDPDAAARDFDAFPALAAAGDTVRGPGTSNLLDLHLLAIA
jgi:hydroxypyruvate reductase